jgi:hypothetical protein
VVLDHDEHGGDLPGDDDVDETLDPHVLSTDYEFGPVARAGLGYSRVDCLW